MDIFTWFSSSGSSSFDSINSWPCSFISIMCTSLLHPFEYTSSDKLQLTETIFSSSRSLTFGWFTGSGVYDVRSGLNGTSSEHSSKTSFSFLLLSNAFVFVVRISKCSSNGNNVQNEYQTANLEDYLELNRKVKYVYAPGGCRFASSSITGTNGFFNLRTNFFTDCRLAGRILSAFVCDVDDMFTDAGNDDVDGFGDFWQAKRITLVALLEHGLMKHSSLKYSTKKQFGKFVKSTWIHKLIKCQFAHFPNTWSCDHLMQEDHLLIAGNLPLYRHFCPFLSLMLMEPWKFHGRYLINIQSF